MFDQHVSISSLQGNTLRHIGKYVNIDCYNDNSRLLSWIENEPFQNGEAFERRGGSKYFAATLQHSIKWCTVPTSTVT